MEDRPAVNGEYRKIFQLILTKRFFGLIFSGQGAFYLRFGERNMSALTRHCHQCGWEWTLSVQPGRGESCQQCNADLRVCLNCSSYDPHVAEQCRDRRADPVLEKAAANFCEFFEFARRAYVPKQAVNKREAAARDALKKLLGD